MANGRRPKPSADVSFYPRVKINSFPRWRCSYVWERQNSTGNRQILGKTVDKRQCIVEYAKKQIPKSLSTLGFCIIKTDEQFKSAYAMHDLAIDYVARQYLQGEFGLYPLGVDLRMREVIIENELPDYLVEKGGDLFCFDAKAKSSTNSFGWVNERAAISYRKLARECSVPIYPVFVYVAAKRVLGRTGHCSIEDEPISKRTAWDHNTVWVFRWKEGLPRL